MIIKIILIGFFAFLGIYLIFLHNSQSIRAWRKIALALLVGFAVFSVLYPEATTDIAKFIGVGRGADLLFYLTVVAVVYLGLYCNVRFRSYEQKIVQLTRKIAILESKNNLKG